MIEDDRMNEWMSLIDPMILAEESSQKQNFQSFEEDYCSRQGHADTVYLNNNNNNY